MNPCQRVLQVDWRGLQRCERSIFGTKRSQVQILSPRLFCSILYNVLHSFLYLLLIVGICIICMLLYWGQMGDSGLGKSLKPLYFWCNKCNKCKDAWNCRYTGISGSSTYYIIYQISETSVTIYSPPHYIVMRIFNEGTPFRCESPLCKKLCVGGITRVRQNEAVKCNNMPTSDSLSET